MKDCKKDKKVVIILSIVCGLLLFFLLISGALNYKQNNEKNSSASNLQTTKSSLQNTENELQKVKNSEAQILESQKEQLRQLYKIIGEQNIATGNMASDEQIRCLVKQLTEKYTPFDVAYNLYSSLITNLLKIKPSILFPDSTNKWLENVSKVNSETCAAGAKCNIPTSSPFMKYC